MKKWLKRFKKENGAITVMTAVMLTVVIGFTALTVDIGLHYYRGAKLQNAADAAATAVAGNLGTIDTSLEDIAYEYLTRNGFDREVYGTNSNGEQRLKVNIERKGEVDLESIDDDIYIKAGYYKITVKAEDNTLLAKIVDVDSLKLEKTAYVKAEANYVRMPKALNYTIFGGSTKGTDASPTIQLNGRVDPAFSAAMGFVESGINLINSAIVQPLIGFFGGTADYNDLVHINLSEIVCNGDVHSNSNIGVGVQALNVSRIKDRDFEGDENVEAYAELEVEDEEFEAAFNDYGQVTFTACDDIRFNYPQSYLFGFVTTTPNSDSKTRIYVANQQYIEQTQQALNIIDLLDFSTINSTSALQSAYENAADIYLEKVFNLTDNQKQAIRDQKDNLRYVEKNKYKLVNQGGIVYYIHASVARDSLTYVKENGIDGLVNDLNQYGNDKMFSSGSTTPLFSGTADKSENVSSDITFIKKDKAGDTTDTMNLNISGNSVARDYGKVSSSNTNYKAVQTGVRYAVARTFMENSDYISVPNLKPYFTRQVNKSIRNATKIKEDINTSDKGERTVKKAVKKKTEEYNKILENTKYTSEEYRDVTKVTRASTSPFFVAHKNPNSGSGNSLVMGGLDYYYTVNATDTGEVIRNYSANHTVFKGKQLYDNNNSLRTPLSFVQEYRNVNSTLFAQGAIDSVKSSEVNALKTAVTDKKAAIKQQQSDDESTYLQKEQSVKAAIEDIDKPNITHSVDSNPEPTISVGSIPSIPGSFIGYGKTGDNDEVPRNTGIRKSFDDFIKGYGITVSTDDFTVPGLPGIDPIGTKPTSGSGTWGGQLSGYNGDQYTGSNAKYDSAETPWYRKPWTTDTRAYNLICETTASVKNSIKIDTGKYLVVNNGGKLSVGGNFETKGDSNNKIFVNSGGELRIHGDIKSKNSDTTMEVTGLMHVGGKIYSDGGDRMKLYVKQGGEVYTNGDFDMEKTGDYLEVEGKTHIGGKIYFNAEQQHVCVKSTGELYVNGNVDCNDDNDDVVEVYGKMQIKGNLRSVKDGTFTSGKRNFKINVKNGGVLIVNGNIDCQYEDYVTVESGGTLIVQDQITVNNNGSITVNGTLIQLNASKTVDTSSLTISGGKVYAVGSLNSKATINLTNGSIYTLSNIYANNDDSGNDYLDIQGTSYVYVRGILTTNGSKKKHLYIHEGNNSVVSILGQGSTDCFGGTCSQIHANNNSTGNTIYLGKTTRIYENNENIIHGSLYCFGSLTFDTNVAISFVGSNSYSNGFKAYITGNFTASSTSGMTISQKYTFCVLGNMTVRKLTINDSKVSVKKILASSDSVTLLSNAYLEVVGEAQCTNLNDSGGTMIWPETISFDKDTINASNIAEFLRQGDVTVSYLNLTDVKLKIIGDLTVNGDISITTTSNCKYNKVGGEDYIEGWIKSQLYVTGTIKCTGSIYLDNSEIYADHGIGEADSNGNATSNSPEGIYADNHSLVLCRNDVDATTLKSFALTALEQVGEWFNSYRANIYCRGEISAASGSRIYAEGSIVDNMTTATSSTEDDVEQPSFIYGFYSLNMKKAASEGLDEGVFTVDGKNSTIFCGEASSTNKKLYHYINGKFYYPKSATSTGHLEVAPKGYAVFLGNVTADGYYLVDKSGSDKGYYYCEGVTKIKNCAITNRGKMYLLGGFDYSEGTKNRIEDVKKTTLGFIDTHDYYKYYCDIIFAEGSESYMGHEVNSGGTFEFSSYYDSRGDVYFEDSLNITNYLPVDDDCKDLNAEKPDFPNRGIAVYIPSGKTYVDGNVSVGNDNAIYIKGENAGLIARNNINYGCSIYNYGKLYAIEGNLNLRTSATWTTDHKDSDKQNRGISIKNGSGVGSNAQIFVGGRNTVSLPGYVVNYGKIFLNTALLTVRGYSEENKNDDKAGEYAYFNFEGASTYVNGPVRLNSHQLFNAWKNGNRECVFACNGKLTYGSCVYNCGKLLVEGDITNNETTSETVGTPSFRNADNSFSFMNGVYVIDQDVVDGYKKHDDAVVYCGGTMQFGKESDKKAGAMINLGQAYIGGELLIYTYDEIGLYSLKEAFGSLENFLAIAKELLSNPFEIVQKLFAGIFGKKYSYYYSAYLAVNGSQTIIGSNFYAGAGVGIGNNTIFMCGGDYKSSRATKIGANVGFRKAGMSTLLKEDLGIDIASWPDIISGIRDTLLNILDHNPICDYDNTDLYQDTYFYVGGNCIINTFGRTNYEWGSNLDYIPVDGSRDCKVYSNTNMFVGGDLLVNSKLEMKENVTIAVLSHVDTEDDIYNADGTINEDYIYESNTTALVKETFPSLLNHNDYKMFVYQSLDEGVGSKLIVRGNTLVHDVTKIRDMTKNYIYGSFRCHDYFELGKALDDKDETEAKETNFRTPEERLWIANHSEEEYLENYKFANSAYMMVDGNFEAGGSYSRYKWLSTLQKLVESIIPGSAYVKIFASSALAVNGNVTSHRYLTMRHDAKLFANGNVKARTSIDVGSYSNLVCAGDLTASGLDNSVANVLTTILSYDPIKIRDQVTVAVGGNMTATSYIELGKSGDFVRTQSTVNKITSLSGADAHYNGDEEEWSESPEEENSDDPQPIIDGEQGEVGEDTTTIDTTTELALDASDEAVGGTFFVKGNLTSYKGYIKEFAFSSVVVGNTVYCPKYITVRHNADLWVMPETFGNQTYEFIPYQSSGSGDTFLGRIWEFIKELSYNIKETFRMKSGSVYTLGELTVNMNGSVMGTYDCIVPGQCVLRQDSLVYFGHDFECTAPSLNVGNAASNIFNTFVNWITGGNNQTDKAVTGFDSKGTAGPGYRYTCKNTAAHNGYYYHMTTREDEPITGTLVCDVCGQEVRQTTKKKVQVSYPAVVYANNDINILTTIDMQMTYLVANNGEVNLYNLYTKTDYNESNLKELPNAIASYKSDINYFAIYGKLASLFYAPQGEVDFDGYYSEIWGCVLGDTVTMNCYYQAFHRFNNWRTMDLQIAESGSVYLIPEKTYKEAPDNVDPNNYLDDTIKRCPYCNCTLNETELLNGICSDCGKEFELLDMADGATVFFDDVIAKDNGSGDGDGNGG